MNPYRNIAPAPSIRSDAGRNLPADNRPVGASNSRRGEKRNRHDRMKWEELKEPILQIYADHSLADTRRIVQESFRFQASIRRYREQLKAWGAEKNIPANVKSFAIHKQQQRLEEGLKTVVLFNGVYLDDAMMQKFATRQKHPSQAILASPPTVTPEGVEYLTPFSPKNLLSEQAGTPQAFTPVSKLLTFAVENYETLKSHPLARGILQHNEAVRKIRYITPSGLGSACCRHKSAQETCSEEPALQKGQVRREAVVATDVSVKQGHVHHSIETTATGNGRFEREQLLQNLVGSSQAFANNVLGWTRREEAEPAGNVALTLPMISHTRTGRTSSFSLAAHAKTSTHRFIEPMLTFLQHNKLLRCILGLSQEDVKSWIGPWRQMPDDEADLFHNTAKCLAGDPAASHPQVKSLIVLVHFESNMPNSNPFLLRIFVGNENSDAAECCHCDKYPVVLDYIGGHGSLKLQAPAVPDHRFCVSLEGLLKEYEFQQVVFFSRWSSTAYMSQGLCYRRELRACHCNGAIHQYGFKPHYIDLLEEMDARDDQWRPLPAAETEEVFQPYPGEADVTSSDSNLITIERPYSKPSKEDRWDPLGQDAPDGYDCRFESHPSDDESEQQYISKPKFREFVLR